MTLVSPEVPQHQWPTEAPAHPPVSADIEPIPAYVNERIDTSEGQPPYQIVTLEDLQNAQAERDSRHPATKIMETLQDAMSENGLEDEFNHITAASTKELRELRTVAPKAPEVAEVAAVDAKESSAASTLMNLLAGAMEENGLKNEFVEIMNTPDEVVQEATKASRERKAQADAERAAAQEADAPVTGMRNGILRASAWLARGRDAVLKHTVGRAAQVAQARQEAAQPADGEQTEVQTRNEKLKKVAMWAAVGAGAVAAAGVTLYLRNKGAEFINDHSPMHFGGGPKQSDLGRHVGEMAGQHSGPKAPTGAGNSLQEALNNATNHNFSVNAGDTPWSVLTRNGVAGEQVYGRLTDAAQHLQADKGIPFEWHGTGTHMWLEVGGKSDTQSVMDALSPYL